MFNTNRGSTNLILIIIVAVLFIASLFMGMLVFGKKPLTNIASSTQIKSNNDAQNSDSRVFLSKEFEDEDIEECKHFRHASDICYERKMYLGNKKAFDLYMEGVIPAGYMADALKRLEEGKEAIRRGDVASVIDNKILSLAEQGDFGAQVEVGDMYAQFEDYEDAIKWYEKAAASGYSLAKLTLGEIYERGLGVPQDYKKAFDWYFKAQEGCGDERYTGRDLCFKSDMARYKLGKMYERGRGVPQDDRIALDWYIQAAKSCGEFEPLSRGVEPAGLIDGSGQMVLKGSFDCPLTSYALGEFYENKMQDYKKAMEWYAISYRYGDGFASHKIGLFYYEGKGIEKDLHKACRFLNPEFIRTHPDLSAISCCLPFSCPRANRVSDRARAYRLIEED